MPHDCKGQPLKKGDVVSIPCEVLAVSPGDFCTLQVRTLHPMPGNGEKSEFGALNAAQVELVKSAPVEAEKVAV